MYNDPSANKDTLEFIELYNTTNAAIDITSYRFTSGILDSIPNGTIPAKGYYVIAIDSAYFKKIFGVVPSRQWASTLNNALNNTGEKVTLVNKTGAVVFEFTYRDSLPFPKEPDGFGPSLVFCNKAGDPNDGKNWSPSQDSSKNIVINGLKLKANPFGPDKCTIRTNVNEILDSQSFMIYPNPTLDFLNIYADENISELRITDINGRLIYLGEPQNKSLKIDFQPYSKGMYFVLLTTQKGVFSKRIIK
jgi:Lamin Tail Domain/Secretion system C-terminal sorting domain